MWYPVRGPLADPGGQPRGVGLALHCHMTVSRDVTVGGAWPFFCVTVFLFPQAKKEWRVVTQHLNELIEERQHRTNKESLTELDLGLFTVFLFETFLSVTNSGKNLFFARETQEQHVFRARNEFVLLCFP